MPRKGENIYKRKDGRWESRYICSYDAENKAKYAYVCGRTYSEVKQKLIDERGPPKQAHQSSKHSMLVFFFPQHKKESSG